MNARYLAHHIIYKGVDHPMSVLVIDERNDGCYEIRIEPFTRELHSTVFHSGTIIVADAPGEPQLTFE